MGLDLEDFIAFDPYSPDTYPERRFLCPLCGIYKPRDAAHRSVGIQVEDRIWKCHRCKESGRLGGPQRTAYMSPQDRERFREEQAKKAKEERERKLVQFKQVLRTCQEIADTPGQEYLERRGISLQIAKECGVAYCSDYYGRPAVMFGIESPDGLLALQGRYMDSGEPRMRSVGPSKEGLFFADGFRDGPHIICEAPIDAICLRLLGYPGAAATMGTDLRDWVARFVGARKVRRIIIATDNDEEGNKAASVWAEMFRDCGVKFSRVIPPMKCKDWNEYWMKRKGLEAK